MGLTLRLVRHGETDWSAAGRYTGHTDLGLNDRGVAQAAALGPLAAGPYAGIWCSDLLRCRETARLMGVDAVPTGALREFDLGTLEGRTWDDLDEPVQQGLLRFDGFVAPDGESVAHFTQRIDRFVGGLTPGVHLIITHGGVIRHLLRRTGSPDASIGPGTWRDLSLR